MTWFRVETNIAGDKRIQIARTALHLTTPEMVGYVVILSGAIADHNIDGRVDDLPDGALEDWAKWRGEPGAFAREFRKWFVDPDGVISDWEEMQGKLIARRRADTERKRQERADQRARQTNLELRDVTRGEGRPQDKPPMSDGQTPLSDPNDNGNGNGTSVVVGNDPKPTTQSTNNGADQPPPGLAASMAEPSVTAAIKGVQRPTDEPIRCGLTDARRALELTIALNKGMRDNAKIPDNFIPALPGTGHALTAAADIADAGVEHDWAVRAIYTIAQKYEPDPTKIVDTIGSIAYTVARVTRAWAREAAKRQASTGSTPETVDLNVTSNGISSRGPVDLKGLGIIEFGRLRDSVVTEYKDADGKWGSSALRSDGAMYGERRMIRADVLATLSPASRVALQAIGGERKISYPAERENLSWNFAAAYQAAARAGHSTEPTQGAATR